MNMRKELRIKELQLCIEAVQGNTLDCINSEIRDNIITPHGARNIARMGVIQYLAEEMLAELNDYNNGYSESCELRHELYSVIVDIEDILSKVDSDKMGRELGRISHNLKDLEKEIKRI